MTETEFKVIRYCLASVWLITGIVSLGVYPVQDSLKLLAQVGISGTFAVFTIYFEAVLDILMGVLTLTKPCKLLWQVQVAIIIGYSTVIALCLPEFLIHPFGPILKNLPILVLLWLLNNREQCR